MEIHILVFVVGLALGGLAILSVCWVWIRHQMLGIGGAILSISGVVLVGLSVWQSVSVEWTPGGGLRVELERLQQQFDKLVETSTSLTEQVEAVARTTEINKEQFVQLTEALGQTQRLTPQQLERLREPVVRTPEIDPRALENLRRDLQQQLQPHR